MAISLDVLKKRKVTTEDLKKVLAPDPKLKLAVSDEQEKKIKNLRDRIRTRITKGREYNLENWQTYYALDRAWDIPFNQTSVTLLQSLMEKDLSDAKGQEEVNSILTGWGFNPKDVLIDVPDPKSPDKTIKQINVPAFFQIFVPLVRAYTTIRWARIMNLRRIRPFLKYEAAIQNQKTRLQSEVVTNRIGDVMARQYGYWNVLKQAVFQMLHYSFCIMFPVEEWHCEEQWEKDDPDSKKTVKEGLRYHIPHPTRTIVDQAHRPSTYNTDTGCEYAAYWRVLRYKDVKNNPLFWNTDKISKGAIEWWSSASTFFSAVYNSCTIKFPVSTSQNVKDRETKMLENYYSSTEDDMAVQVTEYFEKLIPSENGLGDYDCPVWFRFVIGGDDTILYAAPLPYNPIVYLGYDGDENREQNASLSLEILPFQDQVSNLLTQFILTCKQNLTNVTFVDKDVVGQDWVNTLRSWGERIFKTRNFIPFSGRLAQKSMQNVPQAFFSHHFPALDTNGILMALKTVLDIMERVLVMSSQEVGQAASHELREKEVVNIANATSTRLEFTSSGVDDGREAWKLQLYNGLMAYGDDEFYAEIPYSENITPEILANLGFTWNQEEHPHGLDDKKLTVKVKKQAIQLFTFASSQDWMDRTDDMKLSVAMASALANWLNNPMLGPAIGPDQALGIVNLICRMAGFPKEFRLENRSQQTLVSSQEQLKMIVQAVENQIIPEVKKSLEQMMTLDKEQQVRIEKIEEVVKELLAEHNAPQPPTPGQYDNIMPENSGQPINGPAVGAVPTMAV